MRSPFALVDVSVIIMIDASVDGTDYDVWGNVQNGEERDSPSIM